MAAVASGIATIVYPKLITLLLRGHTVFFVYRVLAVNILAFTLILFVLVRNRPEDMGLKPYGAEDGPCEKTGMIETSYTLRQALTDRSVLTILPAAFLLGAVINPISSHISILYITEGYSQDFAAGMVSLFGVVMLVVKPAYGFLTDRFGVRLTDTLMFVSMLAACIVPFFFGDLRVMAYLFIILYGLTTPLSSMTFPLWIDKLVGKEGGVATVLPLFKTVYSVGALMCSVLPGVVADRTGSYVPMFWYYMAFSAVSYFLQQAALRMAVRKGS